MRTRARDGPKPRRCMQRANPSTRTLRSSNTMIREDLARYVALFPASGVRKMMFLVGSPGIQGVLTYRFGSWMDKKPRILRIFLKPVYAYLWHRVRVKW